MYGPKPIQTYSKGEFHGILFVQFYCTEDRDIAIQLLKNSGCQEGGNKVWANRDQKLEERVISSLVFGTKKLLCKSVWADPDTGMLTVGKTGAKILKGTVVDMKLQIEYGADWEAYLHDPKHPEFKELVQSLHTKLSYAETKGAGKFGGEFSGKAGKH